MQSIIVSLFALICVTLLSGMALYKGINGKIFALSIGVIGLIAGVSISDLIPIIGGP